LSREIIIYDRPLALIAEPIGPDIVAVPVVINMTVSPPNGQVAVVGKSWSKVSFRMPNWGFLNRRRANGIADLKVKVWYSADGEYSNTNEVTVALSKHH
jgi:hypothetical protein